MAKAFPRKAMWSIWACSTTLVEKSGAWYSYKGERIGQGRENAKQFLRENADVFKKVDMELRKQLGLDPR